MSYGFVAILVVVLLVLLRLSRCFSLISCIFCFMFLCSSVKKEKMVINFNIFTKKKKVSVKHTKSEKYRVENVQKTNSFL